MTNEGEFGQAYAFFYSSASPDQIKAEFSDVRKEANTPTDMRLELKEGIRPSDFNDSPELAALAREAINYRNNYTIIATLPGHDNKKTAGELGDVLNTLYSSSIQNSFHRGEDTYIGGVFYRDNLSGRYEFLE